LACLIQLSSPPIGCASCTTQLQHSCKHLVFIIYFTFPSGKHAYYAA